MKKLFSLLIFFTSLLWALQYTCPMHPQIISDKPGNCPICGMNLVEKELPPLLEPVKELYTCPMHPQIISDKPGNCPICGMDLVKKTNPSPHADHVQEGSAVTITASTRQNMGIVTEPVGFTEFGEVVKGYGIVTVNDRLSSVISVRVEGWIETLRVNARGDEVKKGELLFTLYSPELLHAQRDYLNALQSGHARRVEAAANRLLSLGMAKQNIDIISKKREPFEQVPFYADSAGIINDLPVKKGDYLKPGMKVLGLTDYSSVWVIANVSEQDVGYLDRQTPAEVLQRGYGDTLYKASIDYIYPEMDQNTRTIPVRLVLPNSDGKLRPGNYVDVTFEGRPDRQLSVPSHAILHHSDGQYVIVAREDNSFIPRLVRTGFRYQGKTAIVEGLEAGERIVTSGQFLIDSESSLQDALRNMYQETGHDHGNH